MVTNGYFEYCIQPENTVNADGEVVVGSISWSEPIPCHIVREVSRSEQSRQHYTVTVESTLMPAKVELVRLYQKRDLIGQFDVIGMPVITSMNRTKLIL